MSKEKEYEKETEKIFGDKVAKISTVTELRDFTLAALVDTAREYTSCKLADSIANLAGKAINTVKVQLEYSKLRKEKPNIDFLK